LLRDVSIPRSGFCSFKLSASSLHPQVAYSFNPSVGILFIQASQIGRQCPLPSPFQSLGRDSVHSSCSADDMLEASGLEFQSLGRDSVHSSFSAYSRA